MRNEHLKIILEAINKATGPIRQVSGSFKKLKKSMGEVKGAVSNLNNSLKKNEKLFKRVTVVGGAVFTGLGLGIKKTVSGYSDLVEINQKFGVVYSKIGNQAENISKKIAKGYGLSQREAKGFLADLGDITSGFGLGQKESLAYAEKVTKLGVDLASFTNIAGGSKEAIDRLNKGFLGEHENLKALGIIINEKILKDQLLADGTANLTGLELERAKIQARMTIAIKQSKNAIGDFARSKQSLANQTRILNARMQDLSDGLGKLFYPIILKITEALIPIIDKIGKWAEKNPKLARTLTLIAVAVSGLAVVFGTLGLVLPSIIAGASALATAFGFLLGPIGLVAGAIGAGIYIGLKIVKNWDLIKQKARELGTKISDLYKRYGWLLGPLKLVIDAGIRIYKNWDKIKATAQKLWKELGILWAKFSGLGKSAYNWGANMLTMFTNGIKAKLKDFKKWVGNIAGTISDYLGFHSPTKKGPASDSDKWMPNLIKMLSKGLEQGESKIRQASAKLASGFYNAFHKKGFGIERFQKVLENTKSIAQETFSDLKMQLDGTKTKITSLNTEIKGLNDRLSDVNKQLKNNNEKGRLEVAKRGVKIEKDLKRLNKEKIKASKEEKRELDKKIRKLQEEYRLVKSYVNDREIKQARIEENKSETQKIIDRINQRKVELEEQKKNIQAELQAKQNALSKEKELYKKLNDDKKKFEKEYLKLFQESIEKQKKSIEGVIKLMYKLNDYNGTNKKERAEKLKKLNEEKKTSVYGSIKDKIGDLKSKLNSTQFKAVAEVIGKYYKGLKIDTSKYKAVFDTIGKSLKKEFVEIIKGIKEYKKLSGKRAKGGRVEAGKNYLVGEEGEEMFTPSRSGYIVPNNKLGGGINVSFGNVIINNGQDEKTFFKKVERVMIQVQKRASLGY